MKRMSRVCKLCLHAMISHPSFLTSCMLPHFVVVLLVGVLGVSSETVGDKGYAAMLSLLGMEHIVFYTTAIFCKIIFQKHKFYIASESAKRLITVLPILLMLCLCVFYDAVTALLMGVTGREISDLLIINAVMGMVTLVTISSPPQSFLQWLGVFPFLFFLFSVSDFGTKVLLTGFGLPVWAAVCIAILLYVIGTALALLISSLWWKKGNRFMELKLSAQHQMGS